MRETGLHAALVIGTTLLSLAAGEVSLRLGAGYMVPVSSEAAEAMASEFDQDLPGLAPHIRYDRNRFGLRALSMQSLEKPAATLRILCLGASTTDQATQSTPDTWCAQLESTLRPALATRGLAVETAAYGRGGSRTADVDRWARAHLASFSPDLVITLLGINDLAFSGAPGSFGAELAGDQDDRSWVNRAGDACARWSYLCRQSVTARDAVAVWWRLRTGRALEWHSRHLPELRARRQTYLAMVERPGGPDALDRFSDSLGHLLDFLRQSSVTTLVLGQPVLWKAEMLDAESKSLWFPILTEEGPVRADGRWLEAEMTRFNRVQRALATSFGAAFLDLDARIPKTLESYFDDCHFTDEGSRRVAREVAPEVLALLTRVSRAQAPGAARSPR